MSVTHEKKLFLGARLKRLRRELDLTQSRMADELGVSPSYLNLLERNQRPVTAQMLLRLADAYDLDLRTLSADGDAAGAAGLEEVLGDPLFKDLKPPRHEIAEMADQSPTLAEAFVRLYRAYVDGRRMTDLGVFQRTEDLDASPRLAPSDWVRDVIQSNRTISPNWTSAARPSTRSCRLRPRTSPPPPGSGWSASSG